VLFFFKFIQVEQFLLIYIPTKVQCIITKNNQLTLQMTHVGTLPFAKIWDVQRNRVRITSS
jgi:hypothetical protein